MKTYSTNIDYFSLLVDYKISEVEGQMVPLIDEEEKVYIIEMILEELTDSQGFKSNVREHFDTQVEGDTDQPLSTDDLNAEVNWENKE